jgi:hypothetical protein
MKASVEVKADILKAMLADDRLEVRTARSLIYSVISAFIIASFTLTSIALKPEAVISAAQTNRGDRIIFWIDVLIIPVMVGNIFRSQARCYGCTVCRPSTSKVNQ